MTLPSRLFSGALISLGGRMGGTALSILSIAILTRALLQEYGNEGGVAAYGVYTTVLSFLTLLAVIADGGLYTVLTRELGKKVIPPRLLLESLWTLRFLSIGVMLLVSLVVVFLSPYSLAVRAGIFVGVWGIVSQMGSQLLMGVFQERLRLFSPAFGEILGRVVQLLGTLGGAFFHAPLVWYIALFSASSAVTFLWNIIAAQRYYPFSLFPPFVFTHLRMYMKEAWPIGLSLFFTTVFFKVDSVLLSFLQTPTDVALYTLPYKVLESLLFFPAMIGGMLLPLFSASGRTTPAQLSSPLQEAAHLYTALSIPITGGIFFLSPFIIHFLGGEAYDSSIPVLQVLSCTLGFLFFGNLFGNAALAAGQQKAMLGVSAFLMVFNIGINLVVIPRYSFMGAAWTTFITEVCSILLAFWVIRKKGVVIHFTPLFFRIGIAGVLFTLLLFLPLPSFPRLVVALGAYGVALLWMRVFSFRSLLLFIEQRRAL